MLLKQYFLSWNEDFLAISAPLSYIKIRPLHSRRGSRVNVKWLCFYMTLEYIRRPWPDKPIANVRNTEQNETRIHGKQLWILYAVCNVNKKLVDLEQSRVVAIRNITTNLTRTYHEYYKKVAGWKAVSWQPIFMWCTDQKVNYNSKTACWRIDPRPRS